MSPDISPGSDGSRFMAGWLSTTPFEVSPDEDDNTVEGVLAEENFNIEPQSRLWSVSLCMSLLQLGCLKIV